jgi:hypothetical protein
MTDQPQQQESSNSVTNVSGGVNANAERMDIGGDVVGRDKTISAGTYIERYYAGGEAAQSKPKVYHNLPQPDYGHFVGREQELKRVHELLSSTSRHFVVTIDGIGGIGKSTLALEVAHYYLRNFENIAPEERFEAIIWASAKQTVLTVDGIMPRHQMLRTLDDIYTTIAIVLQRKDITQARSEEQAEVVINALTQQRALLVIDNLETIDDESVMGFLRELPAPTKAIVTTRHRIDVAYPIRLTGMPWDEAEVMIGREGKKKDVEITLRESLRLYQRTGGVPLAIVWSVAQLGLGYEAESVLARLGEPTNDITEFCFAGSLEKIFGSPAHSLLMGLSIFATDASREVLGEITGLPTLDRDEGLRQLEHLSLINRIAGRFSLLPLTKSYTLSKSDSDTLFGYRRRALSWMTRTLETDSKGEWPKYRITSHEKDNFLQLIYWALENDFYPEAFQSIHDIFDYFWSRGFWNELLRYLSVALAKAEQLGELSYLASCKRELGTICRHQGRYGEAIEYIQSVIDIARALDDRLREAKALRNLSMIYLDEGDTNTARKYLKASLSTLEHFEHPEREDLQAHILTCFSDIALKEEQLEEARGYMDRSQQIAERLNIGITLAVIDRQRGKLALKSGSPVDAERLFRQSLESSRRLELYQDQGYANRWLAIAKVSQGDLAAARDYAYRALEIFTRLGMRAHLSKTKELIGQIESGATELPPDIFW